MTVGLGVSGGALLFSPSASAQVVSTYNGPGGANSSTLTGDWSDPGNWTAGVPTSAGDTANFVAAYGSGNKTVTIDGGNSRTVGTLNIGDTNATYRSVTIAASTNASLIFDNKGNGATLAKTTTTNSVQDEISAPVVLADNLTINMTDPTGGSGLLISGPISESGGARTLTKIGGTLARLSGANTYTGATIINAGTLQLGSGGTTGTLALSSTITTNGVFGINRSNDVTQGVDFSGSAITGSGSLAKTGAGTLTLNTVNTYAGGTSIAASGGVIAITNGGALGGGGITLAGSGTDAVAKFQVSNGITVPNAVNIGGATNQIRVENLSGTNTLTGPITFNDTGGGLAPIQITAGTLNLTGNMTAATVTGARTFVFRGSGNANASGSITNGSATVGVTMSGTGQLKLSGASSYTGGTSITSGVLLANADSALGAGNVTLTGTGILTETGGATNNYINDAATLSIAATSLVNLNYSGTDTINTLVLSGVTQAPGVYGAIGNPLVLPANQSPLFGTYNLAGGTDTGTVTVLVPEPASVGLLALAGFGFAARRRVRRR